MDEDGDGEAEEVEEVAAALLEWNDRVYSLFTYCIAVRTRTLVCLAAADVSVFESLPRKTRRSVTMFLAWTSTSGPCFWTTSVGFYALPSNKGLFERA